MTAISDTTRRVATALRGIDDPCLAAAGIPGSIVDLGLVQQIRVAEPGRVEVDLSLTEMGCAFTHHLIDAVHTACLEVEEVDEAQVNPVWTWEPSHARPELVEDLRSRAERLPGVLGSGAPRRRLPLVAS